MTIINPYNTILIFDWDDTILPNSWLQSKGIRQGEPLNITEDIAVQLEALDDMCTRLLNRAQDLGRVIIVTNSMNGWVEISSRLFLPRVHKFLTEIQVISARKNFQHLPIQECKVEAFKELIDDGIFNILSFGDSYNDRDALFLATKDQTEIYSKSFKFIQTPTIDELKTQYQILINKIDELCRDNKNLDMVLMIKKE